MAPFGRREALKGSDGKELLLPGDREKNLTDKICTRPFAVDWDGDGKLDLVVGNFRGTFFWFKGEGKGKFSPKAQPILVDGKPLKIPGSHSDPFVIDINGDGALDIVSGSSDGGVYWAENVAGKGKPPQLKPFRPLIKPGPPAEYDKVLKESDLKRPTYASRSLGRRRQWRRQARPDRRRQRHADRAGEGAERGRDEEEAIGMAGRVAGGDGGDEQDG